MNTVRAITTSEMIGEFLRAELHSSRFRAGSLKALHMLGYDEDLLENMDYENATENAKREKVLGLCRGWPNKGLFTGFPTDMTWLRVNMIPSELKTSYRLKSTDDMTETDRLLGLTADRVMRGEIVRNIDNNLIQEIRSKIELKQQLPPIILVGNSLMGKKVLIEGHSRSVAYSSFKELDSSIPAVIGISGKMGNWAYF